jgi:flagellar secretion chaperone FliS
MAGSAANYGTYKRVDVETASQGKLVVMLFNGAIQRAEEARRQVDKGSNEGVHNNLIRAQDIIAELRSSLDMKAGTIAANLDRIYEYIQHLLVKANIRKDADPIAEAIEHMTAMRDSWKDAFDTIGPDDPVPAPPRMNQHGSTMMNIQG